MTDKTELWINDMWNPTLKWALMASYRCPGFIYISPAQKARERAIFRAARQPQSGRLLAHLMRDGGYFFYRGAV